MTGSCLTAMAALCRMNSSGSPEGTSAPEEPLCSLALKAMRPPSRPAAVGDQDPSNNPISPPSVSGHSGARAGQSLVLAGPQAPTGGRRPSAHLSPTYWGDPPAPTRLRSTPFRSLRRTPVPHFIERESPAGKRRRAASGERACPPSS